MKDFCLAFLKAIVALIVFVCIWPFVIIIGPIATFMDHYKK